MSISSILQPNNLDLFAKSITVDELIADSQTIDGNLTVTGDINAESIAVQNATVTNDLSVQGNLEVNGEIHAFQPTTLVTPLTILNGTGGVVLNVPISPTLYQYTIPIGILGNPRFVLTEGEQIISHKHLTKENFFTTNIPFHTEYVEIATNTTVTALQLLQNVNVLNANTGGPYNLTMPTAASIIALFDNPHIGLSFEAIIVNNHGSIVWNLIGNTGITLPNEGIVSGGGPRRLLIRISSLSPAGVVMY
jgi:hypothetical protein